MTGNQHWPLLCAGAPDLLWEGRGGGGGQWPWQVALFGNLGSELLGGLRGSALGPPEAVLSLSLTRMTACHCPIKSPVTKRGPTPAPSLWEAGELAAQGHFSEGRPQPSRGPAGGDGAGESILQEVPGGEGLQAVALLLPPAAQPGEGLVLRALELGEAQLVEDLIDPGLRSHLGRTEERGCIPGEGGCHPGPLPPSCLPSLSGGRAATSLQNANVCSSLGPQPER